MDTACDNAPEVRASFTRNWDEMRAQIQENASAYSFMSRTNVGGNFYYSVCLPHHLSFSRQKEERISERRIEDNFSEDKITWQTILLAEIREIYL